MLDDSNDSVVTWRQASTPPFGSRGCQGQNTCILRRRRVLGTQVVGDCSARIFHSDAAIGDWWVGQIDTATRMTLVLREFSASGYY